MKAPPTPIISLPIKAISNDPAMAVTKQPKAIKIEDDAAVNFTPYRSTSIPAGIAKKIPGTTTIDIKRPAEAWPIPNSRIIGFIKGGTIWRAKANVAKAKKAENSATQR
jgi:hypothetical protein